MAKAVFGKFWEVPEPKSYEQVSLVKLTPPWLRFKWVPTINVWGGGYVAGKPKRSGDWDKGGTYQSPAKYRTATILPANKKKWQMLDQEVYRFGTRLSFLQLFLGSAPVLQLK